MARTPSAVEAAAIAAAIERFRAETAPASDGEKQAVGPWQRAALVEGVGAKASILDLEGKGGAEWRS